jgi:hypothetical protein
MGARSTHGKEGKCVQIFDFQARREELTRKN